MRFLIQCADKTTKTVDEETGRRALMAWGQGHPIILGERMVGLSPHMISKIVPMREWIDEQVDLARRERRRFCKYGQFHGADERCTCRTAGLALLPPEEAGHAFPALLRPPAPLELAEGPQTPEEAARQEHYERQRTSFLKGHAIPSSLKA